MGTKRKDIRITMGTHIHEIRNIDKIYKEDQDLLISFMDGSEVVRVNGDKWHLYQYREVEVPDEEEKDE